MSGQAVGSGVQPVGFVGAAGSPTTQAGFAANNSAAAVPTGGVAPAGYGTTTQSGYGTTTPANGNQFRAGGMQVNDLTRAPMPPGYQAPMSPGYQAPMQAGYQAPMQASQAQFGAAPAQPAFTPISAPIIPASGVPATAVTPANGMSPVQPTQYQQSPTWQGTNVAPVPDAEVASRMVPVTANPSNATVPVTQSAVSPAQNQATSGAGSSDLMWRRPGS